MAEIKVSAGRKYGHVAGHSFLDVDIAVREKLATLVVSWGSSQGSYVERHGEVEYARRGSDAADAVERVRDAALAGEDDDESPSAELRGYVETAAARALRELAEGEHEAAA